MRSRSFFHQNSSFSRSFLLKGTAVLTLFLASILIVACGTNSTTTVANPSNPQVTVTIDLNNSAMSPTPSLPQYECGAWATQSSPPYGTSVVGVYAKFVQLVKSNPNDPNSVGNPVGVDGASAVATVNWPDGTQSQVAGTTGTDGLVTFPVSVAGRSDAIDKITLVTVQFTKDGVPTCIVDQSRAAFFTLINGGATEGSPIAYPTKGTTGGAPVTNPTSGPTPRPKH